MQSTLISKLAFMGSGPLPPNAADLLGYIASPNATAALLTTLRNDTVPAVRRNAAWALASLNLTPYAGQSVRILIEAADASGASLVEAAVDDVTIVQS